MHTRYYTKLKNICKKNAIYFLAFFLLCPWIPSGNQIAPNTIVLSGPYLSLKTLLPIYQISIILPHLTTLESTFTPITFVSPQLLETAEASSLTANPDSTHVDGTIWAYHSGGGVAWSSIISGSTYAQSAATQGSTNFGSTEEDARAAYFTNNGYVDERTILQFNTSSLTSGASISAANVALYGVSEKNDCGGSPYATIVTSSPASLTSIATSDFGQIQYTAEQVNSGGRVAFSSWSITGYNTFALNSTGISNISLTGTTKFAVVTSYDQTSTAPCNSDGDENRVVFYSSGSATNKPELNVTYTVSATTPSSIVGLVRAWWAF